MSSDAYQNKGGFCSHEAKLTLFSLQVEAMMDCLRLEWSTAIAETIISLYDCIQDYGPCAPSVPSPQVPDSPCNIAVNVALSHINLFLIVNEDVCIMTRIDAVTLEQTPVKSGAVISGLKVVDTVPYRGKLKNSRQAKIVSSDVASKMFL